MQERDTSTSAHTNHVQLRGRITGVAQEKELPSGDLVSTFRLTVDRPPRARSAAVGRRQVDTIDVACWSPRTRGSAARVAEGDVVEVDGSLRRRFFRAGAGPVSRYEVEATRVRRVSRRASTTQPVVGP